jgi:hypothetical protein
LLLFVREIPAIVHILFLQQLLKVAKEYLQNLAAQEELILVMVEVAAVFLVEAIQVAVAQEVIQGQEAQERNVIPMETLELPVVVAVVVVGALAEVYLLEVEVV